jgi:hypothetical protein
MSTRFSCPEVLVDRRVLAGQGDQLADLVGLGDDVEAADAGPAGVGPQQGGQDAHRRRLAGPVGAEHGEDRAGLGGQVDPGQGGGRTEALDQAVGLDGSGHWLLPSWMASVTGSMDAGAETPVTRR